VILSFDTSVLVAALVQPHPGHTRAACWIEAVTSGRAEGQCSWHAVAETWSVLTRLPIRPAIAPPLATVAIERLTQRVRPMVVGSGVYRTAIRRCSERGLSSGALFDALHLVSAEKCGADALITFNAADFERLALEQGPAIVVPPDPPRFALPE
jgi:predicted nucleic acid-binding protein